MRLSRAAPLVLAAVSILGAVNEAQARYLGNLNLFVGEKWLNSGDWSPADQQRQYGLMLAFGEERAPVHFAIDLFLANVDVTDANPAVDTIIRGASTEIAIGVRKVWGQKATRPHLGAGVDVVQVSENRDGPTGLVKNSDRGYGAWVDGGVTWRIASHLNLGFEARYSVLNVYLGKGEATRDVTAGGIHLGVLIGYGW
jgi:hypothetical protein